MRCQEVRCWTFKGLVAAFVDLSVAFLLLCTSSLVYLSSKFLGLFGLDLPCPCDGLFSAPHKNKCFQETFGDLPVQKISSVHTSVRDRTPFHSILCEEANGGCLGKKRKGELENTSGFHLLTSQSLKKATCKTKTTRLNIHRSPYGRLGHKIFPAGIKENDPLLVNSKERTFPWEGEGTCSSPVDLTYSGIPQKTIEILEQVLAKERAARTALAVELEKERNAAATAADEEKASVEMEAKQYQRMIDEKSAFDAEEMSILKEILLRREREKHFLEKEVDTYRQMLLETEKPTPIVWSQTPQQQTEEFDDMGTADVSSGFIFTTQMDSRFLALGNKSMLPEDYDDADSPNPEETNTDEEIKVNGVDQYPDRDQSRGEGLDVRQEMAKLLIDVEAKEREEGIPFPELVSNFSNISDSRKLSEDAPDVDCHVHDIHVVTDEDNIVQVNLSSDHGTRDLKLDRSQSVSDTSYGLQPPCSPGQRYMSHNMRRNSMSAVDYERLKIESEVGLLRGRLRAVQKGREKLSFSSKEHSKLQVQRLGDKTSQFSKDRRSGPLDSLSPSSARAKAMSITLDLHSA